MFSRPGASRRSSRSSPTPPRQSWCRSRRAIGHQLAVVCCMYRARLWPITSDQLVDVDLGPRRPSRARPGDEPDSSHDSPRSRTRRAPGPGPTCSPTRRRYLATPPRGSSPPHNGCSISGSVPRCRGTVDGDHPVRRDLRFAEPPTLRLVDIDDARDCGFHAAYAVIRPARLWSSSQARRRRPRTPSSGPPVGHDGLPGARCRAAALLRRRPARRRWSNTTEAPAGRPEPQPTPPRTGRSPPRGPPGIRVDRGGQPR